MHFIRFMNLPVNESDNTGENINCVDIGYIWSLKNDVSRHTVLAISVILLQFI